MKTQDIFDLVREVLDTIPKPWPGDVIDQVCLAIEKESKWLNRYVQLVSSHGKAITNQSIGRHTYKLSDFNKSGPVLTAKSELIKTFSWLSFA